MANKTEKSSRIAWEMNRAEVLDVIRIQKQISRSELAEMVSVSRGTVSGIVTDMLATGLLEEVGEGESTGGRPPIKLRYRPESRMAIGLVLFNNQVQAALTDLEGNLLNYLEVPVAGNGPEIMLEKMQQAAETLLEGVSREHVMGIGVGVPGLVDMDTGVIEISVSKGWLNSPVPVREYLERALGLPVHVVNRSRVAALGEFQVGVGKGIPDLLYLYIGQGIAVGIVLDGKLYLGTGSAAGEAGHVSVEPEGPLCACGNRGCLEVYATEAAIMARARAYAREDTEGQLYQVVSGELDRLNIYQVLDAARQGDEAALKALAEAGSKIGFVISILIDLFAPKVVVIGGPVGTSAGELLLEPAIKEAKRRTLPRSFLATQIVNGALGTKAVAIGAAVLAINRTPIESIFGG